MVPEVPIETNLGARLDQVRAPREGTLSPGYDISSCVLACDTVLCKVQTSELFSWINKCKNKTRKQQKNLQTFDLVLGHFHSWPWLQVVHGPHTRLPIAPSQFVLCLQGTHVFVLSHAAFPYVCLLTSVSPYICLLTSAFPYVCWSWSGSLCCSHPLKSLPTWILQLWPLLVFCVKRLCRGSLEWSPSRGRSSSSHLIHLHLNKLGQANL